MRTSSTEPQEMTLHHEQAHTAHQIITAGDTENKRLVFIIDIDHTLVKHETFRDEQTKEKHVFAHINNHLIEHIADALNALDTLAHVDFHILSSRVDDESQRIAGTHQHYLIQHALDIFHQKLNEKIKIKHRKAIFISNTNIHCLSTLDISYKFNPRPIGISLFHSSGQASARKNAAPDFHTSISHSLEYTHLCHDDETNKGIYLQKYLIPFLKRENEKLHMIVYDDNIFQLESMKRHHNPSENIHIHTVQVYRADTLPQGFTRQTAPKTENTAFKNLQRNLHEQFKFLDQKNGEITEDSSETSEKERDTENHHQPMQPWF